MIEYMLSAEYVTPQTCALAYLVWIPLCILVCRACGVRDYIFDGVFISVMTPLCLVLLFVFGDALLGFYN